MSVTKRPAQPSWDFPRSPVACRHVLDTAEAHGVGATTCLEGTGLSRGDLDDPATEVRARQELTIVRNLVRATGGVAGLGIETGLRYNLSNAGIFGYAMLASPTVRDAVSVGLRYASLSSTFLTITLNEHDADAALVFDDAEIPLDVRRFLLERDLAAIAQILPLLLGDRLAAIPARLELRLPGDAEIPFGLATTITFHAPRNAVAFPRDLLDMPLPAADPHTAQLCAQQCQNLLDRRRRRAGHAGQVRTRLLRDPANIPSMATVAAELSIAERTLHRRLADEDTSYRALVDELRETLAVELLDNGLTVEQVARRLGYSETASFTHAYTRWRGTPPSHQPGRPSKTGARGL